MLEALVDLINDSKNDPETHAEGAAIYAEQGMYPQSIYELETVLTLTPQAWNVRHESHGMRLLNLT
jgi:ER membrane protein complex subunit 2